MLTYLTCIHAINFVYDGYIHRCNYDLHFCTGRYRNIIILTLLHIILIHKQLGEIPAHALHSAINNSACAILTYG